MHPFNKQYTNRFVEPIIVPWSSARGLPHLLTRDDALFLSALPALAHIGTLENFGVDWSELQGKRTATERNATTSAAFMRIEGGLGAKCRIALGTTPPMGGKFVSDWNLDVKLGDDNGATLHVSSYKALDGRIRNAGPLQILQETLPRLFGSPVALEVEDGLPDLAQWIVPVVLRRNSAQRHDYATPLPDCFADGTRIDLGSLPVAAVNEAIRNRAELIVSGASDAVVTLDISSGADAGEATLSVVKTDGGQAIHIRCPQLADLSLVGQHRIYRCALRTLRSTANKLEQHPAPKQRIEAFIAKCTEVPLRSHDLTSLWSDTVSAASIPFRAGGRVPIGLVMTSDKPLSFDQVLTAERSLMVRIRTWSKGRKKSRELNRLFYARRPGALKTQSGGIAPYLRYVNLSATEPDLLYKVDAADAWFWETSFRKLDDVDGAHRALLLADGLSTVDDNIMYGPELFTLFKRWTEVVRAADPSVRVETLMLSL